MRTLASILVAALLSVTYAADESRADDLAENNEVIWSLASEPDLLDKANELGTPVSLYEFVRNEIEYVTYHGSRSSSTNTFLGRIGNDVNIASTLIAMLRSQGIRARYAVATVRAPSDDVTHWLGVRNVDLAASVLDDQGIQNVVLSGGGSHVEFEHVWVQAFVPLDHYRGAGPASEIDCVTAASLCSWVDLAPAFKQKAQADSAELIDLYGVVSFDYGAFYDALNPAAAPPGDGISRSDKGPLEIYEEQLLAHLRLNFPGKTLEDVADDGAIIPERRQLLPGSLPFAVQSTVESYDNVSDHDAVGANKSWRKNISIDVLFGGVTLGMATLSLAEVSTQRLTLSLQVTPSQTIFGVRLGGESRGLTLIAGNIIIGNVTVDVGTPFDLVLSMDGPPDTTGTGTDEVYEVTYPSLIVGGYYAISTGGETSNFSQVHRAARELLLANETYPIVLDPSGEPYVDTNGNGAYTAGIDVALLDDLDALDALTGGLLFTAQELYFARLREARDRLQALNHVIAPISGFLGVVSSVHEVEYLDETAYSVMPGGLLIDMKGIQFNGNWRNDQPEQTAPEHFELYGHIGSSLEHEIWQEITGYDALSTVRGIQFALRDGATMVDAKKNASEDTLPGHYADLGFVTPEPAPWQRVSRPIYSSRPNSYRLNPDDGQARELSLFKSQIDLTTPSLRTALLTYDSTSSFDSNVQFFDDTEASINTAFFGGTLSMPTVCGGGTVTGSQSTLHQAWSDCWDTWSAGQGGFLEFLDESQGFVPAQYVQREELVGVAVDLHDTDFVRTIRDDLYLRDFNVQWVGYLLPSRRASGPFYLFNIYLRKQFEASSGALISQTYAIRNYSGLVAGGGYVNGEEALDLTNTNLFNNEQLNDETLVSLTNNNRIQTPSTADPISTVTGNMYMDETDVVINGRGLPLAFTRTYNSGSVANAGSGLPLSPGWTHSYAMNLVSNDFGRFPNADASFAPENANGQSSSITYRDERGGELNYLIDDLGGSFAVTPPSGAFDSLALDTPNAGLATLTFRNGVRYVFDAQGGNLRTPGVSARLSSIEDPYSNSLHFTYDGSGRLTQISDNLVIPGRTGLSMTYTAGGRLETLGDWSGRTWQYTYDGAGNLSSVTNPEGHVLTYSYHAATGLLDEIIKPEDRDGNGVGGDVRTSFDYYRNAKAFKNRNAFGQGETVDYDLYRKRTRIEGPRGFIRQHFYDPNGVMTKLVEPDGGIKLFEHTPDHLRFKKTDPLGFETSYSYRSDRAIGALASDNGGLISRETDALNQNSDIDYGIFDQPTTTLSKRGHLTTGSYYAATSAATDAVRGKLFEVRATLGGVPNVLLSRNTYYASGAAFGQLRRTIEFIDPGNPARQRTTDYVYAANGIDLASVTMTGATSGGSLQKTFTHDALGRVSSETLLRRTSAADPTLLSLTTTFEYDALNRVIRATDPSGTRVETTYDDNGMVSSAQTAFPTTTPRSGCAAPSGGYVMCTEVIHRYDEADRRIESQDILGHISQAAYDEAGNAVAVTDANGHVARVEYDALGRRKAIIAANGHRQEIVYDLAGRPIKAIDPNGHASVMEYDALGRLIAETTPSGRRTELGYDADGNPTTVLDANATANPAHPRNAQNVTSFREYDELGRMTRELDPLNGQTLFSYDLLGNVTTLTDAEGQTTTFVYDDLGRQVETRDPVVEAGGDHTDRVLNYDEAGNALLLEDRSGRQQRRTYDVLNRLTRVEFLADGSEETYSYDAFQDLVSAANNEVTYTFSYTARHELASKTDSRLNKSVAWTYDPAGNVLTKTNYEGDISEFQYDSANRLVALRRPEFLQVSYHYDAAGRLIDRLLSSGARTAYSYDDDNRLSSLRNFTASGTLLESYSYTRDETGQITQIADSVSGRTVSYGYDALYRLASVDSTDNSEDRAYTYDAVGNRKTLTENGSVYHYCYGASSCAASPNGNRLASIRIGGTAGPIHRSFSYDDNGRVLEKRDAAGTLVYALAYDGKGRVSQAGATAFAYDARNFRIQKDSKLYHLDGEHLDTVYDTGGEVREQYLRGVVVDEIVSGYRFDSGNPSQRQALTFHHDPVNSVTALSGHAGTSEEATRYDAFGTALNLQSPGTGNDLLFTGRELDRSTGLYYYRARYYDPEIGRFLSEDPLGFEAGINFYAYVENNPVNFSDPTGKDIYAVSVGGGAANVLSNIPGLVFPVPAAGGVSVTVAVDSNLDWNVVVTPEIGLGTPGVSGFIRGVWAPNDAAVVTDLEGFGASVSPQLGPVSTSVSFPYVEGVPQLDNPIFEAGYGTGPGGVSATLGYGIRVFGSDASLNDPANVGSGGTHCQCSQDFSFGDSYSGGASGGFVLYPSKPNLNQVQRVYAK